MSAIPDRDDLARDLSTADRDEDCKADQPVRPDTSEEYLMPVWLLGLLYAELDRGVSVTLGLFENSTVTRNYGHEEQRAREITPE